MSGQTMKTTLGAPETDAEAPAPRPAVEDDDRLDPLEGVPREVVENVGAYDTDSAGGCG